MKATGNFEARDVDPMVVLSDKTRAHIDHWLSVPAGSQALPPCRACMRPGAEPGLADRRADRRRGQVPGPAAGLGLRGRQLLLMFETEKVGRNNVAICTNISCWLNGAEDIVRHCEKKLGIKHGESTRMAASTSSARKSAWPAAAAHR